MEWHELVLSDLREVKDDTHALRKELHQLHVEIERLKIELKLRSGIWGLVAGAVPGIGALLYTLLS